jgi:tetratricopeptide (TPR) repeat protein
MLGTAMHYNDAHYEDIVRVLKSTLDSPPDIAKDAYFTLAVVHLSFENPSEAAAAMRRALELIEELRRSGDSDLRLAEQEEEAREFFQQMAQSDPKKN